MPSGTSWPVAPLTTGLDQLLGSVLRVEQRDLAVAGHRG